MGRSIPEVLLFSKSLFLYSQVYKCKYTWGPKECMQDKLEMPKGGDREFKEIITEYLMKFHDVMKLEVNLAAYSSFY